MEKAKISVHPDDILSENALHRLVHALCGGYNEDVKSMQYDDELLIRYRSCDDSRTKGPRHVDRRRESSARAERDIVDDNFQVYSKSDRRNERSSSEAVGEGNFNNIYGFSIRRRDEKLINSPCSVNLLEAKQRHKHMKIENRPVPTVSIVASHAQEVDLSINRSQNCRSGENIQTSAKSRRDASLDYTNPLHRNDHSIILEDRSGADFNAGESTFNFDRGDNLRNERDNYENKRLKSASQKEIMGKSNCVA